MDSKNDESNGIPQIALALEILNITEVLQTSIVECTSDSKKCQGLTNIIRQFAKVIKEYMEVENGN